MKQHRCEHLRQQRSLYVDVVINITLTSTRCALPHKKKCHQEVVRRNTTNKRHEERRNPRVSAQRSARRSAKRRASSSICAVEASPAYAAADANCVSQQRSHPKQPEWDPCPPPPPSPPRLVRLAAATARRANGFSTRGNPTYSSNHRTCSMSVRSRALFLLHVHVCG